MPVVQTTVEFVGLMLWLLPSGGRPLTAVAPRIYSPPPRATTITGVSVTPTGGTGSPVTTTTVIHSPSLFQGIEDHVAVIAYKKSDRITNQSASTWAVQNLNADYEYIVLKNERLRIHPTPPAAGSAIRASGSVGLADGAAPWDAGMPHLKTSKLKDVFTDKAQFAGDAAVVELSGGTPQGCLYGSRVDVLFSLSTDTTVTVEEVSPTSRKLVFVHGARVFIGNVPGSSLPNQGNATPSLNHLEAYVRMSDSSNVSIDSTSHGLPPCPGPPAPIDGPQQEKNHSAMLRSSLRVGQQARVTGSSGNGPSYVGTDFACSNLVWSNSP